MSYNLIYITTRDPEEARKIASIIVEERLAACANILPVMESVYRWKDKIEMDKETVLLLKTTENLVQKTIARVKELHSYEVPCAIALPVQNGSREFLDWITTETKS